GATICYTTNGTPPAATTPGTCSTGTTLANGGTVTVSASETLEAIGTESGLTNSGVGSAAYVITVATPTFSPGAGTYSSAQPVTITSATSGATICYTTNGTPPAATTPGTCSTGTTLANGGTVTVSASETLEAIGTKSGLANSAVASGTYTIGTVPIAFVQVAAATPQSSQSTVSVAYPAAQTAGDLNVVVVGWNDTTSNVTQVTDSQGNAYSLAIGPTRSTNESQSIYYAPNVKGGSNTVTVTFNPAAAAVDLRVLEYKGVNTLDVTAGASGSGTTSNSGSATITTARELIFGANTIAKSTKGPGTNFTSRIITKPDADIAEDRIVSATGSYSATAALTGGAWVMQMVTFK
ncbi:MAG TPA: chitobiase/beta-hexosaminidase C-terminal domain-containing protein, partial [Terriglobales bacterium]|nr:chitobiase/beta-hexosaminidase C-terminal domain-containing protein [Terriglobales bacterium]